MPSRREFILALEIVLCAVASWMLVEAVVEFTHRGYTSFEVLFCLQFLLIEKCLWTFNLPVQSLTRDSSIAFTVGPVNVRIETVLIFVGFHFRSMLDNEQKRSNRKTDHNFSSCSSFPFFSTCPLMGKRVQNMEGRRLYDAFRRDEKGIRKNTNGSWWKNFNKKKINSSEVVVVLRS